MTHLSSAVALAGAPRAATPTHKLTNHLNQSSRGQLLMLLPATSRNRKEL